MIASEDVYEEQLLLIVAELADKYTSMESTSLPYERARMLLGAVIYCVEEGGKSREDSTDIVDMSGENVPEVRLMYEHGYELVIQKTRAAKRLYDKLMEGFDDYGCRNYADTLRGGMPQFFLRYDPRFCPQDHILNLDYPCMGGNPQSCGIDLIMEYLQKIYREKEILETFGPREIAQRLEEICPEYGELFLDNICEAMLAGEK